MILMRCHSKLLFHRSEFSERTRFISDSQFLETWKSSRVYFQNSIRSQKAETDDKNEVSPADMANSHMVEGYYQLADLVDEQKIVTLDGKSSIRFNEFYNPHKVRETPHDSEFLNF